MGATLARFTKVAMMRNRGRDVADSGDHDVDHSSGVWDVGQGTLIWLIAATLAITGCKDNRGKPASAGSDQLNGKDKDVRNALVLDAALTKAKKELAALEAVQPRDENSIANKRTAIDAVEQTLAALRKRLDAPSAKPGLPIQR